MEIYPRWTRYQTESESLLDICLYKDFLKPEFYLDQNESDDEYNKRAEETYLEMAKLYNFEMLECVSDKRIKTAEEIHEEVYEHAKRLILK